jgi:hypothetical protein
MTATLWVEITIAGFVYLLAGIFLTLNAAQVYDLQQLPAGLKEYLSALSVLSVFVSYVLGILMHRLIQILILRPINTLLQKLKLNFNVIGDVKPDYYLKNFVLYQYGSQSLHRELDIQFSTFALFTSLIISLPILGISLYAWLVHTPAQNWALPALATCLVFSGGFLLANIRQRRHFSELRDQAFTELMKLHKKNLSEKK